MAQSQAVGTFLIVEKNGRVYINSIELLTSFKEAVQLATAMYSQGYTNGFEIGKQVGRKNA